jgi:hypothetical protein
MTILRHLGTSPNHNHNGVYKYALAGEVLLVIENPKRRKENLREAKHRV